MSALPQTLANAVYRSAARVWGGLIACSSIVRSVYAQGSVALGQVAFGRSDIDLLVVLRRPDPETADGPELASLYNRTCRPIRPGHIQLLDTPGLQRHLRLATYRGSIMRRTSLLLWGKPVSMPAAPIRPDDAVRWFSWYPAHFFSAAVREQNARNLRKIATEMWSAYAVAAGLIAEPDLTRREREARASALPEGSGLAELAEAPERAPDFVFGLAKRLHEARLPALKPLRDPLLFRAPDLPRAPDRNFVIVPGAWSRVPAEARYPQSFFATPELLHLYLHYVSPFLAWYLPAEFWRLGFVEPTPQEFVRACAFFTRDAMLRFPGFANMETGIPRATIALSRHCLPYLVNGEAPPRADEEAGRILREPRMRCDLYYTQEFGRLYRQAQAQWRILDGLEESRSSAPARRTAT